MTPLRGIRCLAWLVLGLLGSPAFAADATRVWMIASYHAGMAWSDEEIAGVRSQLGALSPPVELQLDFLDTKHVQPNERYYLLAEQLLISKYGRTAPKVLMAADDDALDFALRLRDKHFRGTPIVFSGVSSSRRATLEQIPLVGGIFDDLDIGDSLSQVLALLPHTKRVVVIHDQSRTSLAQVQSLEKSMGGAPGIAVEYLSNLSAEAVQTRLAQLGRTDLVFALPFNRDANGRVLTHEEATDLWTATSRAPIAVTRDVAMRQGVLGGFLVSGADQGQAAGRLAVQVLEGSAPEPLPLRNGESHATFDYPQMLRWGIEVDQLPADSTVLRRPPLPLESLRPHFAWLGVLFGSMLVIIGLLVYGIRVRQASEAALRLSARNYQALFDNSPVAILVRDAQSGEIVNINPYFEALFGYTAEEARQLRPAELSAPEPAYGAAAAQALIDKARWEGPQFFEWRSRRKDGSVFWSEICLTRFELAHGQRTVSTIRDISDRKHAEVMAKELEHRLQQVYQNLPVAVFAINAQHHVTFWNGHMTRMTGVEAKDVVGTTDSWRGVYPTAQPTLANVLVDGSAQDMLTRLFDGKLQESPIIPGAMEGEEFFPLLGNTAGLWVRYCAAPLRDPQGNITGAIETLIDVTRLRNTQTTLEELNRDLEARVQTRNQELKQAMGQLVQSEKMAALGSLVAGVAHELNTPIGNVLAVASTLTEEIEDFGKKLLSGAARRSDVEKAAQRMQEASALIERNAAKAAKLITNFKEVAVDQSSTRRRQFGLLEVVEDVITTTRPLFRNVKHRVELDIPPALRMDSFPGPLEQVLTNFLSNSLNHAFEGIEEGLIRLSAQADATDVVLEYSDNGCGIPGTHLQHVFEPFYTTKLGRGGSGLGLYIVYNLVTNLLGGSIHIYSVEGAGTRFVLRLPQNSPE